jgi:hypothetical protein
MNRRDSGLRRYLKLVGNNLLIHLRSSRNRDQLENLLAELSLTSSQSSSFPS